MAPKSMTLDDFDRPKRHSCRNKSYFGAHQKNEDRPKVTTAKCNDSSFRQIRLSANILGGSSGRSRKTRPLSRL